MQKFKVTLVEASFQIKYRHISYMEQSVERQSSMFFRIHKVLKLDPFMKFRCIVFVVATRPQILPLHSNAFMKTNIITPHIIK